MDGRGGERGRRGGVVGWMSWSSEVVAGRRERGGGWRRGGVMFWIYVQSIYRISIRMYLPDHLSNDPYIISHLLIYLFVYLSTGRWIAANLHIHICLRVCVSEKKQKISLIIYILPKSKTQINISFITNQQKRKKIPLLQIRKKSPIFPSLQFRLKNVSKHILG